MEFHINRRIFLKKLVFLSSFVFFCFKLKEFKKDNFSLKKNLYFANSKYHNNTVYTIFRNYLNGDKSAKKIMENISERRTLNKKIFLKKIEFLNYMS